MSDQTPPEWPQEVCDQFVPVRVIGKGGFASVWMAKPKKSNSNGEDQVAIKIMENNGYAKVSFDVMMLLSVAVFAPHFECILYLSSEK